MRVLVLGGGAREHALCWKLSQSPRLKKLYCAPGNPGTATVAENLPVKAEDPRSVVALAKEKSIDLVVVGPEAPLVAGVADALRDAGVAVFGPGAGGARIEGSKAFAKEVMSAARVPTADASAFTDVSAAERHARARGRIVVKADGLAAGKGVVVAQTSEEAVAAIRHLARTPAGSQILLEELLEGEEVSVIALCDGERFCLLPPARDHKRVGDGDEGPNTGGMGAFAPARSLNSDALAVIGRSVIAPTLKELARRGHPFRGALYAGLMLTREGPRVLEFNCRFGDPETQVLMLALGEDLLPLLDDCARGALSRTSVKLAPGLAVGVVMAAENYPDTPRAGDPIEGLDRIPPAVQVFHAGTRAEGGKILTAGGRVLTVCARGEDAARARAAAYEGVSRIHFRGQHFRRDIGLRAG